MNAWFSTDEYETFIKIIESLYSESDSWDFEITITKEKNFYEISIEEKENE